MFAFYYLCTVISKFVIMLRKFKVSNYKCFKEDFSFDLTSVKAYTFNPECVKNGIVNNVLIYGYNGCGKTNLGWAIFDIVEHLTDNAKREFPYKHYTNAETDSSIATFEYDFLIGKNVVCYSYSKTDYKTLVAEQFVVDGKELISFDRSNGNTTFKCELKGTESLNKEIRDCHLSALKYIKNNSILVDNTENHAFAGFFSFVEHMVFFRSREICNESNTETYEKYIIEVDKVKDFEAFLNNASIKCQLAVVDVMGEKAIAFDFGESKILMHEIVSSGTSLLMLFYYWYLRVLCGDVSFLFVDEFDTFYHHELSRLVVKKLKETGTQFVATTHNTSIMSNDLMRPDCYYLMNSHKILPLPKCTEKELREAHNIEKIYKAGAFNISYFSSLEDKKAGRIEKFSSSEEMFKSLDI